MNNSIKFVLFTFISLAPRATEAMGSLRNFGARTFKAASANVRGAYPRTSSAKKIIGLSAATGTVFTTALLNEHTKKKIDTGLPACPSTGMMQRLKSSALDAYKPFTRENIQKYPYLHDHFLNYAATHIDVLNDETLKLLAQRHPEKMVDIFIRNSLDKLKEHDELDAKLLKYLDKTEAKKYSEKYPLLKDVVHYRTDQDHYHRNVIQLHKGFEEDSFAGHIIYEIPLLPDRPAYIALLQVSPSMRKKGYGGTLIKKALSDIAQKSPENREVHLQACPHGEQPMSLDNLIKFYEKHGAKLTTNIGSWSAYMAFEVKISKNKPEKEEKTDTAYASAAYPLAFA